MFNYLSNALKYSPIKSKITLGLEKSEGEVKISVTDEGKGISKENYWSFKCDDTLFVIFYPSLPLATPCHTFPKYDTWGRIPTKCGVDLSTLRLSLVGCI